MCQFKRTTEIQSARELFTLCNVESQGTMELEDIDRNRFVLDVTKTEFLKEGFNISRVGGSTAGGATTGLAVSKEKGAVGKRSSSRPLSGKVSESERSNQIRAFFVI